ncbi:ImmA/IrrE family metallo-endopeptidase [Pseudomonas sp.]|uniref:ImmA/IrrE family metallo-endopeptidase n=1 Tax=Pseudomonas sp. TaxID=306 RepID=UPI002355EE76|nr:ImmA/IrrE family metallo-endopeptidase [Pseudomonas sp.]
MPETRPDLEDFFACSDYCRPENLLTALKTYQDISKKTGNKNPLIFKDLLSKTGNGALFRRSGAGDAKTIETFLWLSQVQRLAESIVSTGKVPSFEKLELYQLKELSKLSLNVENLESVSSHLLNYGIVLIYLPQTAGMKTDGVLFKLSCGTPVIGMTLRYDRYDYYWFTLMHELAHLVLHYEKFNDPHFDCVDDDIDDDIIELQANQASRDSFVSRSDWRTASVRRFHSDEELYKNAESLSIHPAILAGLVRYEAKNYAIFNKLIHQISVRRIIAQDA